MRKKALRKDFYMEVRKSFNRFISIFLIVALGVAFYSGIQSAAPDMRYSGDAYFDQNHLMDIKVIGTLGLTDGDLAALRQIQGVSVAEPGYMTDVLTGQGEDQRVLHVESVGASLNRLTPEEGRVPQQPGECFVDIEYLELSGHRIGDEITFYLPEEDEDDFMLRRGTFTIVGAGSSPLYISFSRGNTTLGNGEVAGAAYVLPEDFDSEVYTQIYMAVSGARDLTSYTDAYDRLIEKVMDRVEAVAGERCEIRYAEVIGEAKAELADGKRELADGKQEAFEKLADARDEIDSGEEELRQGKKDLAAGKAELADGEQELADNQKTVDEKTKELADGKKELADGWAKLNSGKAELAQKEAEFQKKYSAGIKEVESGEKQLAAAKETLAGGKEEYNANLKTYNESKAQYEAGETAYAQGLAEYQAQKAAWPQKKAELEAQRAGLVQNESALQSALAGLGQQQTALQAQYDMAKGQADAANAQIGTLQTEIASLQAEQGALESEIGTLQSRIGTLQAEQNTLQDEIAQLEAQEPKDEAAISALREQADAKALEISSCQGQITEKSGAVESKKTAISEKSGQIAQYSEAVGAAEALGQQVAALNAAIAEQNANLAQVQGGIAQIDRGITTAETQLGEAEQQLAATRTQLDGAKTQLDTAAPQLTAAAQELAKGEKEIGANEKKLSSARAQLASGKQQIAQAKQQIAANEKKLAQAQTTLDDGEKQLAEGREKLADAKQEIADAKKEIADGEQEIEDNRRKLFDAKIEYADGRQEAIDELRDGAEKLQDGADEIDEIKEPEWMVDDRSTLPENLGYGENADRMRSLGRVFPVLFFLVAALISLTTMTRMVEEERTQIGTLKALGYGKFSIAGKYLSYALVATLGGSVVGILIGEKILPYIIVTAYKIMYHHIPNVELPYNMEHGLVATGAALLCTMAATMAACYRALASTPAVLMRPPAPKEGKRVLLEHIPFLWKPLSFSWKSTVRNLFRYKKRFLMTVIGIGGCMGLMVVGYGIRDSILCIADLQFELIQDYDAMVILDEDASVRGQEELVEAIRAHEDIEEGLKIRMEKVEAQNGKKLWSPYVFVPEDAQQALAFLEFRDRVSGEKYELTDDGAIITEKLAKMMEVAPGDVLTVTDSEDREIHIPIAAVSENYLYHYIYMTPQLYEACFGEPVSYDEVLFRALDAARVQEIGEELMAYDAALSISYTASMKTQLDDMLGALDIVIVALIVSAGLLAFVVLYNLNNININERKRELATIKVLGFYDGEVSAYVYRENILVTIIGIAAGVGLGTFLHRFTITTVEIDTCMFGRFIRPQSFLICAVFTAAFSVFVNVVMHFKLKKIDMVESLKSVE